ncbi:MAG: glutamate--tRNA ligase [Candidatus Firestonebacteria bacterium]
MTTRVRFAPSPTGYMHIGNARTALFNYLFAKKTGGIFVLRIEDTDRERSTPEAVKVIVDSLEWLGLDWDEGYFGADNEKGDFGPYTQMKRLVRYNKYLDKLLKEKKAYYCFCSQEEVEVERQKSVKAGTPYKYSGKCRSLTEQEIQEKLARKERFVVRFQVAENVLVKFTDLVRGPVEFNTKEIGDFVIARSDGVPIYNFAVVIDDHLMKITHVIRGEDHLSNTPRQVLLYQAFGFSLPEFAHLSMILGADRSKLSKRHGETSLLAYRDKGFLPEAVFNYMSLLGWYPKDGVEIRTKEEIFKNFDIKDVGHSGSIFDEKKLIWMNHEYIMKLPEEVYLKYALPYLSGIEKSEEWKKDVLLKIKTGVKSFSQIPELASVFTEAKAVDQKAVNVWSGINNATVTINAFIEVLKANEITKENCKALIAEAGKKSGVKGKDLFMPIRIAITGAEHGEELANVLPALGSAECIKRMEDNLKRYRR